MKAFVITTVFVVFASTSSASYINIISQTNHVWGNVWGSAGDPPQSYDFTDSLAVSGSAQAGGIGTWNHNTAQSSAGNFQVSAHKDGKAGEAFAYAESTYVFVPTTTGLNLTVTGFIGEWTFENEAGFSLHDLTAGVRLVYYVPSGSPDTGFEFNWQQNYQPDLPPEFDPETGELIIRQENFQFDPLHQYQLWIYVLAQRGESGDGAASLNVVFTPEPATLLLLGLGGIFLRSRKF